MTVLDFADYRMRMRAGVPRPRRSYYLTGLTEHACHGTVDLGQRHTLTNAIRVHDPHAVIHDPVVTWQRDPNVGEFHRLTALTTTSEFCVAWLPTKDSITAAAAELQSAHRAAATIIAITDETDAFLIHAFATVVVPDLAAFTEWVQAGTQPSAPRKEPVTATADADDSPSRTRVVNARSPR
jgi:hypothetical protein